MEPEKPTIILSNNVPFMARLIHWFDNEDSIVLLMEYANGGTLMEFLLKNSQKSEKQASSSSSELENGASCSQTSHLLDTVQELSTNDNFSSNNEETGLTNSKDLYNNSCYGTEHEENILVLPRKVPESDVKIWAAEIVLALEQLHSFGVHYGYVCK